MGKSNAKWYATGIQRLHQPKTIDTVLDSQFILCPDTTCHNSPAAHPASESAISASLAMSKEPWHISQPSLLPSRGTLTITIKQHASDAKVFVYLDAASTKAPLVNQAFPTIGPWYQGLFEEVVATAMPIVFAVQMMLKRRGVRSSRTPSAMVVASQERPDHIIIGLSRSTLFAVGKYLDLFPTQMRSKKIQAVSLGIYASIRAVVVPREGIIPCPILHTIFSPDRRKVRVPEKIRKVNCTHLDRPYGVSAAHVEATYRRFRCLILSLPPMISEWLAFVTTMICWACSSMLGMGKSKRLAACWAKCLACSRGYGL